MRHVIYKYLFYIPIFVLFQVLVLNHINLSGYINPLIYIILIITLPQNIPRWFIIIYAFCIGFTLDILESNPGLNSSSLVFISFIKPYLQKLILVRKSVDEKEKLNLQILGFRIFTKLSLSIIIIHNIFMFLLELFSSHNLNIFLFIKQVLLTSIVTYIIIIILQLFTYQKK